MKRFLKIFGIVAILIIGLGIYIHLELKDAKDVMIILDCSPSMIYLPLDFDTSQEWSKMDASLHYTEKLMERIEKDGIAVPAYGVVAYSAKPHLVCKGTMKDGDPKRVIKSVNEFITANSEGILDEGTTATGEALSYANQYLETKGARRKRIMIIFTDGGYNIPNAGRSFQEVFPEIKASGFKLFVFGINYEHDYYTDLLPKFAQETGGEFFSITSDEDFNTAINSFIELIKGK